jgi:hypothetical protein
MSTTLLFQYLELALQQIGCQTSWVGNDQTMDRPTLVFANSNYPSTDLLSFVQCIEPSALIKHTYLLRLYTNTETNASPDANKLIEATQEIYPLIHFKVQENRIAISMDIPVAEQSAWQSDYIKSLLAFYIATVSYNTRLLQDLASQKITLQEALQKAVKQ